MKYLQNTNEFFDFWKKDPDDEIALEFIKRLEKVKDKNPYQIQVLKKGSDFTRPAYISRYAEENPDDIEVYNTVYNVIFDDVEMLITNDRHNRIYTNTGLPAGYELNKSKFKLYIAEERVYAKDKYRKRLYTLVDRIYKDDIKRNRINKINTEINPGADLL